MTLCHYRVIARKARFDRAGNAAGPEGGLVRNDHRHTHHGLGAATAGITDMTVDTAAAHPTLVGRIRAVRSRLGHLARDPLS